MVMHADEPNASALARNTQGQLLCPGIISSEVPDMAFEIAASKPAPAVILILDVQQDLGACRFGLSVDQIGVRDDRDRRAD